MSIRKKTKHKQLLRMVDISEHHQKIASADLWNGGSGVIAAPGQLVLNVHTKEPEVRDPFHTIPANEQGLEFCFHPPKIKDNLLHHSAVQDKVILHGPPFISYRCMELTQGPKILVKTLTNSSTPVRRHCEGLTGAYKMLCYSEDAELKLTGSAGQCATTGSAIPDRYKESVAQTALGGPFYKLDQPLRCPLQTPSWPTSL